MRRSAIVVLTAIACAAVAPSALADTGLLGTTSAPLGQAVGTVNDVAGTAADLTAPLAPVVEGATQPAAPAVDTAAPVVQDVTAPLARAVEPVVGTVEETLAPVTDLAEPLVGAVEPVLQPVVGQATTPAETGGQAPPTPPERAAQVVTGSTGTPNDTPTTTAPTRSVVVGRSAEAVNLPWQATPVVGAPAPLTSFPATPAFAPEISLPQPPSASSSDRDAARSARPVPPAPSAPSGGWGLAAAWSGGGSAPVPAALLAALLLALPLLARRLLPVGERAWTPVALTVSASPG